MITLQKTIYLSGSNREEGTSVKTPGFSCHLEWVQRDVFSDVKLYVEYNFNKEKWEFFPKYKTENEGALINYYNSTDWGGLRKLFPFVNRDENIECIVTIIFDEADVCNYEENYKIDKYEKPVDFNFHAESDFYAVTVTYDEVMLSKGENLLDWEIDNGYVKWDCLNRSENGALIFDNSPLMNFFPVSSTGEHSIGVPYKVKIIVDSKI